MRKICLLALLFIAIVAPSKSFTQDATGNAGDIKLSVIVPDQLSGLNPSQLERLKNKIINLVTENNFTSDESPEGFVIYPYFQVIDTERVGESGLKALTQVNCNFSLFIKHITPGSQSQPVINSLVMDISGGGDNASQAITNAFQLIRPNNTRLQNFFAASRTKIVAYYTQNCAKIIAAAQAATNNANFGEAFTLLTSIPADAKQCYDELQQKIKETYLKMQVQSCEAIIAKAKELIAQKAYDQAIQKLQLVDPQGTCKDELAQLISDLQSKMDSDSKDKVEQLKGLLNNKGEAEETESGNILRFVTFWKKKQPPAYIKEGSQGQDAVIVTEMLPPSKQAKYEDQ